MNLRNGKLLAVILIKVIKSKLIILTLSQNNHLNNVIEEVFFQMILISVPQEGVCKQCTAQISIQVHLFFTNNAH